MNTAEACRMKIFSVVDGLSIGIFSVSMAGSQPKDSTSSVGTREYADYFSDGVISDVVGEVFDAYDIGQVYILAVFDAKAVGHHKLLKVDCMVFTPE